MDSVKPKEYAISQGCVYELYGWAGLKLHFDLSHIYDRYNSTHYLVSTTGQILSGKEYKEYDYIVEPYDDITFYLVNYQDMNGLKNVPTKTTNEFQNVYIYNEYDVDITYNYEVTKVFGTLTITKRQIVRYFDCSFLV